MHLRFLSIYPDSLEDPKNGPLLTIPELPQCNNGFILVGGVHFLDPLGVLGTNPLTVNPKISASWQEGFMAPQALRGAAYNENPSMLAQGQVQQEPHMSYRRNSVEGII